MPWQRSPDNGQACPWAAGGVSLAGRKLIFTGLLKATYVYYNPYMHYPAQKGHTYIDQCPGLHLYKHTVNKNAGRAVLKSTLMSGKDIKNDSHHKL